MGVGIGHGLLFGDGAHEDDGYGVNAEEMVGMGMATGAAGQAGTGAAGGGVGGGLIDGGKLSSLIDHAGLVTDAAESQSAAVASEPTSVDLHEPAADTASGSAHTRLQNALSSGDLVSSWQAGAITALMTTSASAVVHEGWLVKSSVSLKKKKRVWSWKRRYFTLTVERRGLARLHYYTTDTMNRLKGHVDIDEETDVEPLDKNTGTADGTGKGRAHCIRISSWANDLVVQAASDAERSDWLASLTSTELLSGPAMSAQEKGQGPLPVHEAGAPGDGEGEGAEEEEEEEEIDGWKSAAGRKVASKGKQSKMASLPLAERLKANDPSVRLAGKNE